MRSCPESARFRGGESPSLCRGKPFKTAALVLALRIRMTARSSLTVVLAPLAKGAALTVLGFRAADPTGYGRLLIEGGKLVAIREQADASAEERKITLCNAGVMAFDGRRALEILDRIGKANGKGEYYLV